MVVPAGLEKVLLERQSVQEWLEGGVHEASVPDVVEADGSGEGLRREKEGKREKMRKKERRERERSKETQREAKRSKEKQREAKRKKGETKRGNRRQKRE